MFGKNWIDFESLRAEVFKLKRDLIDQEGRNYERFRNYKAINDKLSESLKSLTEKVAKLEHANNCARGEHDWELVSKSKTNDNLIHSFFYDATFTNVLVDEKIVRCAHCHIEKDKFDAEKKAVKSKARKK